MGSGFRSRHLALTYDTFIDQERLGNYRIVCGATNSKSTLRLTESESSEWLLVQLVGMTTTRTSCQRQFLR